MFIESGIIVFVGLLLLFIKLPQKMRLWLLGRPLAVDIVASALAYALHWGTFTGVMAAAVAGLMCSGFTTLGRYLFGYTDAGKRHYGVIRDAKLS